MDTIKMKKEKLNESLNESRENDSFFAFGEDLSNDSEEEKINIKKSKSLIRLKKEKKEKGILKPIKSLLKLKSKNNIKEKDNSERKVLFGQTQFEKY